MPQAIVYCDRCGRIVPPGEIARGQALIGEGGGICASCASTLTPEQHEMLRLKLSGEMPAAGPPPPPAPRSATVRMAARDAAPARRMSTRLTAAMQTEPPARQGGAFQRNIAVVGAIAGVVVGVAIALLVASGGRGQGGESGAGAGAATPTRAPATPPGPPPTAPDVDAPRRSLAEIKTWAEDLPG